MEPQMAFTCNRKSLKKSRQFLKYARTYLRKGHYAPAGLSMKYYLCFVRCLHNIHRVCTTVSNSCIPLVKNDTRMDENCKNIGGKQSHIIMSAVDKTAGSNEPMWPHP